MRALLLSATLCHTAENTKISSIARLQNLYKMATIGDDIEAELTLSQKLAEKGRKSPFLVASLISLVGICGYGAYSFRKRKISTQLFLIQLRVAAQGTAIAILTLGMGYHMVRKHVLHKEDEP